MTQQQTCFYQARCLNQLNCIKPEKTNILVQWCLHPEDSRVSCVSCKTQCNTLSAWLVCFDENCLFLPMIKTCWQKLAKPDLLTSSVSEQMPFVAPAGNWKWKVWNLSWLASDVVVLCCDCYIVCDVVFDRICMWRLEATSFIVFITCKNDICKLQLQSKVMESDSTQYSLTR